MALRVLLSSAGLEDAKPLNRLGGSTSLYLFLSLYMFIDIISLCLLLYCIYCLIVCLSISLYVISVSLYLDFYLCNHPPISPSTPMWEAPCAGCAEPVLPMFEDDASAYDEDALGCVLCFASYIFVSRALMIRN